MATSEEIEKVRQEIMRFRELLDVMRSTMDDGERAYAALFSGFSSEAMAGTKEKDLQWQLAETMVEDVEPLLRAVGQMRFEARELERAFEELHDIVMATQKPE